MKTLRRYSYLAFAVACAHLVFGAIVRISGSGMGCGDHWPKCYGSFFPPLDRPDLIIEVSHRYLASILLLALIWLMVAAWRRRGTPGVGGRRGVLRSASLSVALGVSAALLGAVTVKLGNSTWATLAHWTVAMSLVASVVATVIRAGGFGGEFANALRVAPGSQRAAYSAAGMALLTVVMGGLTAKFPGAAVACPSFPLCGVNPDVLGGGRHVQITHRVLAVLLVFHLLFGVVMALRRRREPLLFRKVAALALALAVLQLLVAGAMIGMHLPPVLRSLHEATGVSVWIVTFVLAYLMRVSGGDAGVGARVKQPEPELVGAGAIRANVAAKQAFSTAVLDRPRSRGAEPKEPWQQTASAFEDRAPETADSGQETERAETAGSADPSTSLGVTTSPLLGVAAPNEAEVVHPIVIPSERGEIRDLHLPPPTPPKSTMDHSVAVIVARGADL
ncbi:MAG: COX15/CtaA family protein [Gemmatimonadota bacterium]